MTKQKLAKITDELVEAIAVNNGARIEPITILCGGKPQESRMAVGGKFDLNASRGIFAFAIMQHKDVLTGKAPALAQVTSPAQVPAQPAPSPGEDEPTEENTAPADQNGQAAHA